MTAVNQWWRNPKSQNSEAIEAIRVSHFAYSLYKKPEHELSATKNSSHHQTNHDKTILFPLNKSCPQSTPALPGNPSSTKGFCQLHHWLFPQGLRQPGITNTTTGGCAFVRQKISPGASLQGRTMLPTLEYLNSNLYTSRNVYTLITKREILTSLTICKLLPLP